MKMTECVVEGLISQRLRIIEVQFSFMPRRGSTKSINTQCHIPEKYLNINEPLYIAFSV